jgi:hypothetical protein
MSGRVKIRSGDWGEVSSYLTGTVYILERGIV